LLIVVSVLESKQEAEDSLRACCRKYLLGGNNPFLFRWDVERSLSGWAEGKNCVQRGLFDTWMTRQRHISVVLALLQFMLEAGSVWPLQDQRKKKLA